MTNDGGPAFPVGFAPDGSPDGTSCGMSLRDWFAGMALQGILANHTMVINEDTAQMLQRAAWNISDAMLKEREQDVG